MFRVHDPPNRGTEDVVFHSIWTREVKEEGKGKEGEEKILDWRAVMGEEEGLVWFNE